MKHNLFQNKEQYLRWASRVKVDGTIMSAGEIDYDLRDQLKRDIPVKFPCITVSWFENSWDRMGDMKVRGWEHVYLAEFTEGFDPYAEEKAYVRNEKRKAPYYEEIEKFRTIQYLIKAGKATEEDLKTQIAKINEVENKLKEKGVVFEDYSRSQ